MAILFSPDEFARLKDILILYGCALKNVSTRMDIIHDDFKNFQNYNPVEHIKSRLKSPESIAEKLHRLGHEVSSENAQKYLYDIAGLRVICSFAEDIYYIAEVLKRQPDVKVLSEKDYVTHPKPSGYRSYHLILEVPVYMTRDMTRLPVEVQIRTQAMDFWASLEHKVRYKYKEHIPKHLSDELVICAEKIAELDGRMFLVHDIISLINPV